MTPRQVLELLYKDMREKLSDYYKSEAKLADEGDGFFDKHYFDAVKSKYLAWQEAHNKFHGYIAVLKEQGILDKVLKG